MASSSFVAFLAIRPQHGRHSPRSLVHLRHQYHLSLMPLHVTRRLSLFTLPHAPATLPVSFLPSTFFFSPLLPLSLISVWPEFSAHSTLLPIFTHTLTVRADLVFPSVPQTPTPLMNASEQGLFSLSHYIFSYPSLVARTTFVSIKSMSQEAKRRSTGDGDAQVQIMLRTLINVGSVTSIPAGYSPTLVLSAFPN